MTKCAVCFSLKSSMLLKITTLCSQVSCNAVCYEFCHCHVHSRTCLCLHSLWGAPVYPKRNERIGQLLFLTFVYNLLRLPSGSHQHFPPGTLPPLIAHTPPHPTRPPHSLLVSPSGIHMMTVTKSWWPSPETRVSLQCFLCCPEDGHQNLPQLLFCLSTCSSFSHLPPRQPH